MKKNFIMSIFEPSFVQSLSDIWHSANKPASPINSRLEAPRTTKSLRLSYTNKVNPPESAGDRMLGYL